MALSGLHFSEVNAQYSAIDLPGTFPSCFSAMATKGKKAKTTPPKVKESALLKVSLTN